jgi:hypothetical protein
MSLAHVLAFGVERTAAGWLPKEKTKHNAESRDVVTGAGN